MSSHLHAAAAAIASKVPFDIVITSGIRTPEAQASAMQTKYDLAGGGSLGRAELVRTYLDDSFANGVADFFQANDYQGAIGYIKSYFDEGKGSSHGRGQGLDIRTTGGTSGQLTESQIDQLTAAVVSLGYTPHREYTPPHLHVKVTPGLTEKKTFLFLAMALGGLWILAR